MIPFNIPPYYGTEEKNLKQAILNKKICGDGEFTKKCSRFFEERTKTLCTLMTTSGTHALEMAARLIGINPDDEVIMPSYTFSSTANAFVQMGAKIVFVDINPRTMNIDYECIARAINRKTKVIVPMHYAGVGCEMDEIMKLAKANNLMVVEDAAQAVNSFYMGKALGTFGQFGCYSFHETKNYSMGEGGALLINEEQYIELAEILREKGTNRNRFFRGQVDKYSWVDYGSSYLPSELNTAYLYAQIEVFDIINDNRLLSWDMYYQQLKPLSESGFIELPFVPDGCKHNAHMFYIKARNLEERARLIFFLKENGVGTAFHYVPLHSAPAGLKYGRFAGEDRYTTAESEKLLRLPMYYNLDPKDIGKIVFLINKFYKK